MPAKPQFGGRAFGMVGLPGQRMAARQATPEYILSPSDGVITAYKSGWHLFALYGAGGRGGSSLGTDAAHGNGGGAALKWAYLQRGQTVSYHTGDGNTGNGDHTTVTLPDGTVITAEQGRLGLPGFVPPQSQDGRGLNGDINRQGGFGHGWTNPDSNANTNDGVSIPAVAGEWGGTVDPNGGGSGAGFRDIFPQIYGDGGPSGYGTALGGFPGGGGQANVSGGTGGAGGNGLLIYVRPA